MTMKRVFFIVFCVLATGCTRIELPNYIKDVHPYDRRVYAPFEKTLKATSKVLDETGWTITTSSEPSVFERAKYAVSPDTKQIMLFTKVKHTPLILWSTYKRINVILRSAGENATDVEVRHVTVTSIPFKSFYSYKKDRVANQLLEKIENAVK